MSMSETYVRWRYRLIPDHVVGELLSKDWIDNAIPVLMLVIVVAFFGTKIPGFFGLHSLIDTGRQLGEYLFPALGMTVVLLAGGIDLSVGSNFALCNFVAIALVNYFQLAACRSCFRPLFVVGGTGGLGQRPLGRIFAVARFPDDLGHFDFRTRYRRSSHAQVRHQGFYLVGRYADLGFHWRRNGRRRAGGSRQPPWWSRPSRHVVLTRMRFGWHLFAVGGSRRSAHNVGISVRRTVCWTYVISGALTACGALFYAARLNNAGGETGVGLEIAIVTAAVLGGNSLGGGRGSVVKASSRHDHRASGHQQPHPVWA